MRSVNFKSVFTNKECEYILSHFRGTYHTRSAYNANGNPLWKMDEHPSQCVISPDTKLSSFLIDKLKNHIPILKLPNSFKVLNYKKGSKFERHNDNPGAKFDRYLTLIIQLILLQV